MRNTTVMSDGGGTGTNYNIDIEAIKTVRTNLATKKEEFVAALNKMNSSVENTRGVISASAEKVRQKYAEASASQSELKTAIDAYINFLDTTAANYEKADSGSVSA